MSVIREEDKLADIRRKISIIKTIAQKCQELTNNQAKLGNPLDATMFLTNEPRENIEENLINPKTMELRSLLKSYQELKEIPEKPKILSCYIHEILYDSYVKNRNIPKLEEISYRLENRCIVGNLFDVLKRRGYIWRRLSGDKCILIEDPEVQAKRMKYLLDMRRFRETNSTIVFVEEKAIPADKATLQEFLNNLQIPESGTYEYVKIAASPQLGLVSLSINNKSETFIDWLKNEVVPHLKSSSVLVLDENMIKEAPINQPPKPEAKKEDMIGWLERNNIPCSSTMHKAELYELIDIFTDKLTGQTTLTEEIFKEKGIELAKIPDGWPILNYFRPIWDMTPIWNPVEDTNVVEILGKRIQTMVDSWSLEKFQESFHDLESYETNLYEKDMELEEVIDKLFTMAKDVMDTRNADLTTYQELEGNDLEKYVNIISGSLK